MSAILVDNLCGNLAQDRQSQEPIYSSTQKTSANFSCPVYEPIIVSDTTKPRNANTLKTLVFRGLWSG